MTKKKASEVFVQRLAALEYIANNIRDALALLKRSVEGKLPIGERNTKILRLSLCHYIINNLVSLFDRNKKRNTLFSIAENFKGEFPKNFFSEYLSIIEKLRTELSNDLGRMRKNRNLSSAHLGASDKEKLGWNPQIAQKLEEWFGQESSAAKTKELEFITPINVLEMKIIHNVPKICAALVDLQMMEMAYD